MTKLNPLSPEVISRQATINIGVCILASPSSLLPVSIRYSHSPPSPHPPPLHPTLPPVHPRPSPLGSAGTIGHVAHGKSTVVKAISGVQVSVVQCTGSVALVRDERQLPYMDVEDLG